MTAGQIDHHLIDHHLIGKYDIKVPRYTSYPTAPHFTAAVDGAVYRDWLADLPIGEALSLYFHIPFCDSMCWFCGCYTKIVQRYEPIAAYLETLMAEVDLVAATLPGRFAARHLHWGGGSPTILKPEDWLRLVGRLKARFDIAADAELAVELDPRDATEEYIAALAAAGVNRASIGVQDFDPHVQAAINRHQPFEVVARVCGWLRKHGIERINLDLMYGLPRQTEARVMSMVDLAVSLQPARIALFGYAHVPWMKSHQKMISEAELPDAAARFSQFSGAAARLREQGYVAIGLDHFARVDDGLAVAAGAGTLHRNFQGYTTDEASTLIGLGASAIGSLPQGYVQNVSPLKDYHQAIVAGRLPTGRGFALGEDDLLRGEVIEQLMCELSCDLAATARRRGRDTGTFADDLARLAPLIDDGLAAIEGDRIAITEAGRPFVRVVASIFDTYLSHGQQRHSRAI